VNYQDVVDDQVVGVKTLEFGVRLCVLEEVEKELGRLLGPATLSGTVNLSLKGERGLFNNQLLTGL